MFVAPELYFFFFFNDTATTEIYPLSLHDALPISRTPTRRSSRPRDPPRCPPSSAPSSRSSASECADRKSTRLNSSHSQISYAVFCLKKKKKTRHTLIHDPIQQLHHPLLRSGCTLT